MRKIARTAVLVCAPLACTVGADDEAMTFTAGPSTTMTTSASAGSDSSAEGSSAEGTDSADSGSEAGSSGGSEQPEDGMYSHCEDAGDCVGLNACVTFPAGGAPTDGYCTQTGCQTAIADCAPAPGGTAGPICAEVTINRTMQMACALDCSEGTCPAGMTCYAYGTFDICG